MRLFICGISGRMGSALCAEAIADGHVIAGGLDVKAVCFPSFRRRTKSRRTLTCWSIFRRRRCCGSD
ncbi:MAG: hypothetical protein ACLUSP_00415 [Christensenellales bacterium]